MVFWHEYSIFGIVFLKTGTFWEKLHGILMSKNHDRQNVIKIDEHLHIRDADH